MCPSGVEEDGQLPHNATRHYGVELQFYVPVADKRGMDEGLPRLTLVWMYEGDDAEERRKVIAALDYPNFEVFPGQRVSRGSTRGPYGHRV